MRTIHAFCAALLVCLAFAAGEAQAVNDWGYTAGCEAGSFVTPNKRICFDFNTSLSPSTTTFQVFGGGAIACLKTDVDQEGVSATGASPATAIVRYCPNADTTSTATCGIQAGAQAGTTLTGANGTPATQLACVVLGPGVYLVQFPTLPDSPDVGLFTVEGGN